MRNPFRYFNSSPEVIRLVVMMYVRYPLSLRNVEKPSARLTSNMRGPGSGGTGLARCSPQIRKKRVAHMRGYPQRRRHLDEVFATASFAISGAPSTMKGGLGSGDHFEA
jgi:putative transposase